jgi:integrase
MVPRKHVISGFEHEMPTKKLTDLTVSRASAPDGGRLDLWDAALPGFGLRVTESGAKSWVLMYRVAGRKRRMTLGTYPLYSLKAAREMAREALQRVGTGVDPALEKTATKAALPAPDTVENVVDEFIKRYLTSTGRSSQYIASTRASFNNHVLPRWRGRELRSITRRDVVQLLDAIVDEGKPVAANRVLAAVRKLLNWSLQRGIIDTSPAARIEAPGAETERDRALSLEELGLVWRGTDAIGYPFGAFVKLAILTAQRRNEVAGMRWKELDLGAALWTIPADRTKAGRAHLVPLSRQAVVLLEALPELGEHVFTTGRARRRTDLDESERRDAPISGFSKAKTALDAAIVAHGPAPAPWTLHDLRRTASTEMARAGVPRFIVGRVLNHADQGVTRIYDRYEYLTEKRDALGAWGDQVEKLWQTDSNRC